MRGLEAAPSAAVPSEHGGRRCAGCERLNDPDRELCRVCGADLDTGRPVDGVGSRRVEGRPRPDRRERFVLAAVVSVVLAIATVLPLALLGLGPFGPSPRLEPAVLLRAAYPGPPTVLQVAAVATTTTAVAPDRDLSPLNLIDGDGVSAWVGLPVDADGAGEVIELVLDEPAWISRVQLRNGDQLSDADYERSGRLQRGLLSFDGGRDHRIDLLDIGRQAQVLELTEPELTTRVTIVVERVFPGSGSRGVALSEVSLVGWRADAADAALARQRAQWP